MTDRVPLRERIEWDFTYHRPQATKETFNLLRDTAKNLALIYADNCPTSREQSLAVTALEESVMWANAAIARYSSSDEE